MEAVSVDAAVAIPVLISVLAPVITGFLQQFSTKFSEKAPWYLKGLVTAGIGALMAMIATYATQGDALLASAGGAVVGALGSMNIALRKGAGRFFDIELQPKPPVPPPAQ